MYVFTPVEALPAHGSDHGVALAVLMMFTCIVLGG